MNKAISISAIIIAIAALVFSIINYKSQSSIYYVNNGKLYDGFNLKIEYEKQIQNIRINRKNMLDSIELTIKQFQAQNLLKEYEYAQEYYIGKAKQFEQEENDLMSEYNQQIWKRLNQYAVDYSKEKNIDILFGASGNGTLLHAKQEIDVTEDLVKYCNKRYLGK